VRGKAAESQRQRLCATRFQFFGSIEGWDWELSKGVTPNRYYPIDQGRWLSPDPANAGADPSAPQTWNMYAYAGNNPTTNTDPDGETYHVCQTGANGEQTNCTDISDQQFDQFTQANKDTLTFTGNGNVLQNGTVIGSYEQTSVDLSQDGQTVLGNVYQTAAGPVNFFGGLTMGFLAYTMPGVMEASLAMPQPLGPIAIGAMSGGGPEGPSSDYIDVTKSGSSPLNRGTNVTSQQFGDNLQAEGFTKSQRGDVTIYTKGNTQYTVYRAKSTGGPTAQVRVNGKVVAKIRLQQ
jgi:RHS repeat-associated protein